MAWWCRRDINWTVCRILCTKQCSACSQEEIGPELPEGQNKWYGGIKGVDGCIYGMPFTATGVFRINPWDDSVEILGNFPAGGWKWQEACLLRKRA
jgi:hypothetical protein